MSALSPSLSEGAISLSLSEGDCLSLLRLDDGVKSNVLNCSKETIS